MYKALFIIFSTSVISWTSQTVAQTAISIDAQIADLEKQKSTLEAKIAELKTQPRVFSRSGEPIEPSLLPEYTAAARASGCERDDVRCIFAARDGEFSQDFYIRNNKLDAFYYLYPQYTGYAATRGASLSLTGDPERDTAAASIKAFGSYAFRSELDDPYNGGLAVSAIALAPYVLADGTISWPESSREKSALQIGLDVQAEVYGDGPFSLQTLGLSPYYQTDFRGKASMFGAQALWEPYQPDIFLGSRANVASPKLIGAFWRAIGEVDVRRVEEAGLSMYDDDTDYAFLGGTLIVNATLFENMPSVGKALCGRVHLEARYSYFYDAVREDGLGNFEASASYDLNGPTTPSNRNCRAGDGLAHAGVAALQFEYANGTDKNTLEDGESYKVGLSYRF